MSYSTLLPSAQAMRTASSSSQRYVSGADQAQQLPSRTYIQQPVQAATRPSGQASMALPVRSIPTSIQGRPSGQWSTPGAFAMPRVATVSGYPLMSAPAPAVPWSKASTGTFGKHVCNSGDVHCSQNRSDGSAKTSVYAPPCCTRNGKWATAAATITSMAYAAASTSGASCSRIYGNGSTKADASAWCNGDATSKGFSPRRPHFVGTCGGNECPSALSAAVMKMLEASVAILPRDDLLGASGRRRPM
eukprot:symbB.v1.2.004106.t1/scaffold231.1/size297012/9